MIKYFLFTHEQIMNMSYDNYMMYLVSIPSTEEDSDGEKDQPTESFNLFDMGG